MSQKKDLPGIPGEKNCQPQRTQRAQRRADPPCMGPPKAASGVAGSHPGVPRPRPPRGAVAAPRDGAHAPCSTAPSALSRSSPSIPG